MITVKSFRYLFAGDDDEMQECEEVAQVTFREVRI